MGVSVEHYCDPEVDIQCDGCGEEIDTNDLIYCVQCCGKPHKHEIVECPKGKHKFPSAKMIEKIAGTMCTNCAKTHEEKLLAEIEADKAGRGK